MTDIDIFTNYVYILNKRKSPDLNLIDAVWYVCKYVLSKYAISM